MIKCSECDQTIAQVQQRSSAKVVFYTIQGKVLCPQCINKHYEGIEARSLGRMLAVINATRGKEENKCS